MGCGRLDSKDIMMAGLIARKPESLWGDAFAPDAERQQLVEILRERTLKRGRFRLASGRESRIYFNMKATMMHPRGANLCARGLLRTLETLQFDYVSGLEMGAVPLLGAVAALSHDQDFPVAATFVRKQPKAHGTQLMVEGLEDEGGESLEGKRVVVIDDVATSGGSILKAVDQIVAAGGKVEHAVVLLDREEGAGQMLADKGVVLHALVTASDLGVVAEDRQSF